MVVSSVTLLSGLCLVNDETDYDSPRCAVSMRTILLQLRGES